MRKEGYWVTPFKGKFKNETVLEMNLRKLADFENERLRHMKQEYSRLPASTLRIKDSRGYLCAYEMAGNIDKGVGKDHTKFRKLAHKLYLKRKIMVSERQYYVLQKAIKECGKVTDEANMRRYNQTLRRVYSLLPAEEVIFSEADLKWMKSGVRNTYKSEDLEYTSINNEVVRSKSELMIANRLDYYGILYKCEPQIQTENHTYYPDFLIKLGDGRKIMWEHFGREDLDIYRAKSEEKIREYRGIGFIRNVNLICTYEENTKMEKNIDDIIEKYLI